MNEQISIKNLLQSAEESTKSNEFQRVQSVGSVGTDRQMNQTEPPCYTCRHALARGPFRICMAGGRGYLKLEEKIDCDKYRESEDE